MSPVNRVTIFDVAREAGVAISTVSTALSGGPGVSDATRARVRGIAQSMGWVPSMRGRSLVSKRAWAVGLLIQRPATVLEADPFFSGFIAGVEAVLDEAGYALLLQFADSAQQVLERLPRWALGGVVDGVFLTDVEVEDARYELVRDLGLPAVAINTPVWHESLCPVSQDTLGGLRELMDHLIRLGHRRIGHVSGPPQFLHSGQRETVWREALAAAGLAEGPLVRGDFTSEGGVRAADLLLRGPEWPTAVVCANDLTAIGFISQAAELGISVPDDISVTGFDGIQLGSYITPSLTTVQTSPQVLGRRAAEVLLEMVAGRPVQPVEVEPAQLILRRSTAVPPRS
ncbi:MAG: LacI family transcriptional regulator [Actinobacteria bacterium]|nr:LacI family transcriptional regulator [Actinomycetota bacterium]